MTTYTDVKEHQHTHRNCMRCNQPATVTSRSVAGTTTMDGWYCTGHAAEGGIIEREDRS